MNHQTSSVPQNAYHSPQVSTKPIIEFPQLDSGLAVHVFTPGDDPIACLNKAMAFMSTVSASRFPSTNNQLRTSSNLRNHGGVTVQQVQGRQGLLNAIIVKVKDTWLGSALSLKGQEIQHGFRKSYC
ncbi:hypothetical protein Tco_0107126 [Tanacetum coccineum]